MNKHRRLSTLVAIPKGMSPEVAAGKFKEKHYKMMFNKSEFKLRPSHIEKKEIREGEKNFDLSMKYEHKLLFEMVKNLYKENQDLKRQKEELCKNKSPDEVNSINFAETIENMKQSILGLKKSFGRLGDSVDRNVYKHDQKFKQHDEEFKQIKRRLKNRTEPEEPVNNTNVETTLAVTVKKSPKKKIIIKKKQSPKMQEQNKEEPEKLLKRTKEYRPKWFEASDKVTLYDPTDSTDRTATFAKVNDDGYGNGILINQNKQKIGYYRDWEDIEEEVPEFIKDKEGNVLDPITNIPIVEYTLLEDSSLYHNLSTGIYRCYRYCTNREELIITNQIVEES